MSRWQAIIFDLDDTLYPEQQYVLSGFKAVAVWAETHLGIPAQQGCSELENLFRSGVRHDTFDRWLQSHNMAPEKYVVTLLEVYRSHRPIIAPFSEVPVLLQQLHKVHLLGLVSDGYLQVQMYKWAALRIAEYFDAVVFSDEWGRNSWKPSVRPFLAITERLGLNNPGMAIYIGDNPSKDFFGARQIGMSTVWLQRPGGEYSRQVPPTEEYAPDFKVETFDELCLLLETTEK